MKSIFQLETLQKEIRQFAKDRDWEKFHAPKNLILALSGEVGELAEVFQCLDENETHSLTKSNRNEAADELADIMIYLIRLFDVLDINPAEAVAAKMEKNSQKYPVNLAKGNATKYNKRKQR